VDDGRESLEVGRSDRDVLECDEGGTRYQRGASYTCRLQTHLRYTLHYTPLSLV